MTEMAIHAVLGDIPVLEEEGSGLLGVAPGAGLFDGHAAQELVIGGAVRLMAVGAEDLILLVRVMAGQRELGRHLLVTPHAGLVDGLRMLDDAGSGGMNGMAVRA